MVPQKGVIGCVFQHALGRQGVCIPACIGQEVSAQGVSARGVSAWEAVSAQEGGGVSVHGVSVQGGYLSRGVWQTPPVNRITDACENITLPQLRCRQ